MLQAVKNFSYDEEGQPGRNAASRLGRPLLESMEVAPPDELHDDERLAALETLERIDFNDVRMAHLRGKPRLFEEELHHLGVVNPIRAKSLHHQGFLEASGVGPAAPKDLGHPTHADALEKFVVPKHTGKAVDR